MEFSSNESAYQVLTTFFLVDAADNTAYLATSDAGADAASDAAADAPFVAASDAASDASFVAASDAASDPASDDASCFHFRCHFLRLLTASLPLFLIYDYTTFHVTSNFVHDATFDTSLIKHIHFEFTGDQ